MRHRFLAVVTLLASITTIVSPLAPLWAQGAKPKPNVVLIMMDDLGYGDLGSYGAPDVKTPNIDRLAREGVRLTDAYANGVVCTPTRTALISGRYQQRVGLEGALTLADTALGLPVTGTSLPALLKANGYATALIGKWHLGFRREFGPRAHGFDEFFGFLEGAHDYYVGGLYEDTTPVRPHGYLTDAITERSVNFIQRQRSSPFFLEVAYNAVHWPFQPPNRPPTDTARRSGLGLLQLAVDSVPATRADYVQMLERADEGVGKILAVLEQRGLARNTLVIFTNDNGGEWLSRNAPFFHRKGTVWEGGIRVPLIIRWPGELPAGKTSGQVALTMDLTASILAATGTRVPAELSAGWHRHSSHFARRSTHRRTPGFLAYARGQGAAVGGEIGPLEAPGRRNATTPAFPVRSRRRSRRTERSRCAASGLGTLAVAPAPGLGERRQRRGAEIRQDGG